MYKIGQRWINETIVYNIVKDFLGEDYEVIQHARPSYLNGLEYDVYVPHLKLAIEYNGVQHHEAVSIFGGEEGLKKTKARDERKNSLSLENGICLIRLNPDYSKEKLFARLRQILSDNEGHEIHVNKQDDSLSIYEEEVTNQNLAQLICNRDKSFSNISLTNVSELQQKRHLEEPTSDTNQSSILLPNLTGNNLNAMDSTDMSEGIKVVHKTYGIGIITNVEKRGSHDVAKVQFENRERAILMKFLKPYSTTSK